MSPPRLPRGTGLLKPVAPLLERWRMLKKLAVKQRSRKEVHDFWRDPAPNSRPEVYLSAPERTRLLVALVKKYVSVDARTLEIGCSSGRNLQHLYEADYRHLTGIDINHEALELLREHFPEMATSTELHEGALEDVLPSLPTDGFDATLSLGVLMTLHTESEWLFEHIARVTRTTLITFENEAFYGEQHFPRNYKRVFGRFGFQSVEEIDIAGLDGIDRGWRARVLSKNPSPAQGR